MANLNKGKGNIWMLVSLILGVILLSIIVYFCVSHYKEAKIEKENALMQKGYEYALTQVIEQAQNCQPLVLHKGNSTTELVDVSCLGNPGSE
jgi:hypothetical protein